MSKEIEPGLPKMPTQINLRVQSNQIFDVKAQVLSGETKYELFKHLEDLGFAEHQRGEEFAKDFQTYVDEVEGAEAQVTELTSNQSKAEADYDTLNSSLTVLESQLSEKQVELSTETSVLEGAQSELTSLELGIPNLVVNVSVAQVDYDLKSAEGSGYTEEEIAAALQALTDAQTALNNAGIAKEALEQTIVRQTKSIETISGKISSINVEIEKTEVDINNLSNTIDSIKDDIEYFTNFINNVTPITFGNYSTWNVLNGEKALARLDDKTSSSFKKIYETAGFNNKGGAAKSNWDEYVKDIKNAEKSVSDLDKEVISTQSSIDVLTSKIENEELSPLELKDAKVELAKLGAKLESLQLSLGLAKSAFIGGFSPLNHENQKAYTSEKNGVALRIDSSNLAAADAIERLISEYEFQYLISNKVDGVVDSFDELIVNANQVNAANQFIYPKLIDATVDSETGVITLSNAAYDGSVTVLVNGLTYPQVMFESTKVTRKGLPTVVNSLTATGIILSAIEAGAGVFVMGVTGDFNEIKFN